MRYPDTSLLVAAVTGEPARVRAQNWFAEEGAGVVISDWTISEFASALALKERIGTVSPDQRGAAAEWFRNLRRSLEILPVSRTSFQRAADLTMSSSFNLRAPDALHLAVAEESGCILYTFDKDQARAGIEAGIRAELM